MPPAASSPGDGSHLLLPVQSPHCLRLQARPCPDLSSLAASPPHDIPHHSASHLASSAVPGAARASQFPHCVFRLPAWPRPSRGYHWLPALGGVQPLLLVPSSPNSRISASSQRSSSGSTPIASPRRPPPLPPDPQPPTQPSHPQRATSSISARPGPPPATSPRSQPDPLPVHFPPTQVPAGLPRGPLLSASCFHRGRLSALVSDPAESPRVRRSHPSFDAKHPTLHPLAPGRPPRRDRGSAHIQPPQGPQPTPSRRCNPARGDAPRLFPPTCDPSPFCRPTLRASPSPPPRPPPRTDPGIDC